MKTSYRFTALIGCLFASPMFAQSPPAVVAVRTEIDEGHALEYLIADELAETAYEFDGQVLDGVGNFHRFEFALERDAEDFMHELKSEHRMPISLTPYRKVVTDVEIENAMVGFGGGQAPPPIDDLYGLQYNLMLVESNQANVFYLPGGPDVKVAVLDSGINECHPELLFKTFEGEADWFVPPYVSSTPNHPTHDNAGHGTHVAGILGARTGNPIGVAGAASNVKMLNVKVLEFNPVSGAAEGTSSSVASGVEYAIERDSAVMNMSLGGPSSAALQDAIEAALDDGIVMVAAAGNDGNTTLNYPAAYPGVLSVAASTAADTLWSGSNFGPTVDVAAPGVDVWSIGISGSCNSMFIPGFAPFSGTSMATPHVSALAAMIVSWGYEHGLVEAFIKGNTEALAGGSALGRVNFVDALTSAILALPVPPAPPVSETPNKFSSSNKFSSGFSDSNGAPLDPADPADQAAVALALNAIDLNELVMQSVNDDGEQAQQVKLRFQTDELLAPGQSYDKIVLKLRMSLLSNDALPREVEVRPYNYKKKKWGGDIEKVTVGFQQHLRFKFTDGLKKFVNDKGMMRFRIRIRHDVAISEDVAFSATIDQAKVSVVIAN